jgi:signal transduction histidine kinase
MFCIASTLLLGKKERFAMYTFSYLLYVIGCAIIIIDFRHFIRNTFFITLLFVLALIVSYIHYSSFINDFINQKIILNKNIELDKLYRATEETLKQRTAELNETVEYEKLRAAFFANISHELRTPLTVIFSAEQMMDLIIKREDFQNRNKDITQYMEVIKQNCFRLIRLVANLIDITKIDAGYFSVVLENYDIIKVVEDITLSVAAFIEGRDINLIFDTEIEELIIACDPDKIERIILNLLSNAVKFTPKEGSIYVNIFEKADRVSIHIKDTGIGIPESMRQSIFERFVQVDKTISRKCEGSGIGLSLVKSLVDLHDGTIRLISEEGKGSEFIIELPKRTAASEIKTQQDNFINENQNVEKINIEFSDIYQ